MNSKELLEQLLNGDIDKKTFIQRMKVPSSVNALCFDPLYERNGQMKPETIINVLFRYSGGNQIEKNISFEEYQKLNEEWENVKFGFMIIFVE